MKKRDSKRKLPWQKPKSKSEEPKVNKLIKNIMNSPTYKIASEDSNFLNSEVTRGIRLELDYFKTETVLKEFNIQYTIVVFGSARIKEKGTALSLLKEVQKELEKDPNDIKLLKRLQRAEKVVEMSRYYEDAKAFGKMVAGIGTPKDNRVILMTGGGPGIMEAANRGAYEIGAKTIGLNIQLPHEQYPNPYISPELCFQFKYFAMRKLHFLLRAQALVAYPGGFGTLDELFEVLTLIQTNKNPAIPVVLVGRKYWKRLIDFEFLIEEGMIAQEDLEIFHIVDSAKEAFDKIIRWHKSRKTDLYKIYKKRI